MDSTGMSCRQGSGPDQAEIMADLEDRESLKKQKVLVKLAQGGEQAFNKAVDEDYRQMIADLESCRMPASRLDEMCRPKKPEADIDFENLEFDFSQDPGVPPEMPPQEAIVPPPGAAQVSSKGTPTADENNPDRKACSPTTAKDEEDPKPDTDIAFSFPMQALLRLKEQIHDSPGGFKQLAPLVHDNSGLDDLYRLYDKAGFIGKRNLTGWILSAQAVQGTFLDQVIMEKIVNECQSQDSTEFRNMVRLRHSNNADVRATLELNDRFSHLPAKPNPGIKINVAAVQQIRSEKQDIHSVLSQKIVED